MRARIFFQFCRGACVTSAAINFSIPVRFIVRSHLSGRTCTSGKNIVGETPGNVRKESADAGFAKQEKLQNTGNDVVSRIRLR